MSGLKDSGRQASKEILMVRFVDAQTDYSSWEACKYVSQATFRLTTLALRWLSMKSHCELLLQSNWMLCFGG